MAEAVSETEQAPKKRTGAGAHPELASLARSYAGNNAKIEDVAFATGISMATVGRILAGHRVSAGTLIRFAAGYRKPTNPLLEAIKEPTIHPDPTVPKEEATSGDAVLLELKPVAERLGVPVDVLYEALRTPEVLKALAFVVKNKISHVAIMKWREDASTYAGLMEGLQQAGLFPQGTPKAPKASRKGKPTKEE